MAYNDNYYSGNQRQQSYSQDNYNPGSRQQTPNHDNDGYYAGSQRQVAHHRDSYQSNSKYQVADDDNDYYNQQQQQQPYTHNNGSKYSQQAYDQQPYTHNNGSKYNQQEAYDQAYDQQTYNHNNGSKYDMTNPRAAPQPPPVRYDPNPAVYDTNPAPYASVPAASYNSYEDQGRYDSRYNSPSMAKNPYPVYEEHRPSTPVSHAPSDYYSNSSSIHLGTKPRSEDLAATPGANAPLASTAAYRSSIFGNHHHQNSNLDDVPEKPAKRTFFDLLCCGCCLCFPKWVRWICCMLLLLIVALAITIGILAALFKTPSVKYLGVDNGTGGNPQFNVSGKSWSIYTGLKIQVINPNIEGITFSNVRAKAFYPIGKSHTPVGGGNLTNVRIISKGTTNITFPFEIDYHPEEDTDQAILTDIATKCGLLGGQKSPLSINYDLVLSLSILGLFTISPTFSSTASFDCPIQNGQLPELPSGLTDSFTGGSTSASASATDTMAATTTADFLPIAS